MEGEVDEMDGTRDQRLSQTMSHICLHDKGVPSLVRVSHREAQYANDCVEFSCAGQWTEDNHLKHTQQDQHGELDSYSRQHMPGEVPDYCAGSIQEDAIFTVSESGTARDRTNEECDPLASVTNLPWHQEKMLPYQPFLPLYLRQQPEAGIGTSRHRQNNNNFSNEFIRDTSVAAKNETWPTHDTFDGSQNVHHANRMQIVAEQNDSNAACLVFAHHGPDPFYQNHDGHERLISNMLPEYCQYPSQPSASMYRTSIPSSSHPTPSGSPLRRIYAPGPGFGPRYIRQSSAEIVPSLNKAGRGRNVYVPRQGRYLAVPMQRRVSSASSQTTEATLSSAVSDPTSKVLACHFCNSTFTGKFGKGNRKRHMKTAHSNRTRSICDVCDRTFRRSDALLKHKRKQHP